MDRPEDVKLWVGEVKGMVRREKIKIIPWYLVGLAAITAYLFGQFLASEPVEVETTNGITFNIV